MSKAGRVLLAILVLIFGFFCAWLPFANSTDTMATVGPILALIVAVALAVGTYFLVDWLARKSSARQEKQALAVLSPAIPAGEALQMVTYGYVGPGRTGAVLLFGALGDAMINASRRKWYYVGLTYRHLILVQAKNKKSTGVQQVLSRSDVQQVEYARGALEPRLIIDLPAEKMELKIEGYGWQERAKAMDSMWRDEPTELSLATA
jgi:hypothetical protein